MVCACKRCGKEFRYKYILHNHLSRKYQCAPTIADVDVEHLKKELYMDPEKPYPCKNCHKTFRNYQSRYVHQRSCASKAIVEHQCSQDQEIDNASLMQRIKQLEEALKQNMTSSSKVVNNITQVNNIVNNNINLNIKEFGFENIKHIQENKEFLTSCLLDRDIRSLVDSIHGDKDHPENHNIRILCQKKEQLEVMKERNGNKLWLVATKEEALGDLIDRCYRILRLHGYKNKEDIIEECEDDEDRFYEAMGWLEEIYQDEKLRKPLKQQLFMLLMNIERILRTELKGDTSQNASVSAT